MLNMHQIWAQYASNMQIRAQYANMQIRSQYANKYDLHIFENTTHHIL